MKTSHITGGKVTEPKVKSYGGRPLHVDMESYKKSVLSDAWSSYGDTRSTVNTKEQGKETHRSDHYPQSSINHRPVTNQRLTHHHFSTDTRPINNEPILNGGATRPTNNNISYSHSWETTTVHPPELISSVYRGPSPNTRDLPIDTSQLLSSVYRGTSNRNTPHVNTSSYRGSSPKATPTTHIDTSQGLSYRGSSLRDIPSTGIYIQQYRDESNHTHSVKPMTRKTRSASGRTDTRVRVGLEPKLKLPQETISTLHETIERQKRELDDLASQKHKQQQRFNAYTLPATNQYTSNRTIPVTSNHQPAPIKRRKIATAPPPKSYAGFTSTLNGPPTLRPQQRQHVPHPPTSNNEQTESPKFVSPRPPLITPSSWRSGQENVNRIIGKRMPLSKSLPTSNKPRLPTVVSGHVIPQRSSNISMLLQELDGDNNDSSDGDVNGDGDDDCVSSDSSDNGVVEGRVRPSNVAMKLRRILDSNKDGDSNTTNKIVEKHYDRNAVRKYMKCKEEEKRRKIKEERVTQQRAQEERERRLKDLQDRQHQILISNLLHQKRQKSDNPTTSDHYYTSHESNYYNSYTSPLMRPLSPPVISPQHTPISLAVSQYTTPIRYTTTTSPRININFTTPPHSHIPVSHVHTPVPHYHTPVSHSHTSVPHSHTPAPHSHTPVSHVHTPVPHVHTPHSNIPINTTVPHYPTPVPSSVYLSPSIHTSVLSSSSTPSSVTPPYSPSKGPISSFVSSPQGSPRRTPISDHHQARILALKQSAIALREKIIAQRHVMTDRGIYSPKRATTTTLTGTTSRILPGISNIHQHAESLLVNQQQDSAATVIQSVWKGYKERKNMLNKPVKPVTPVTSPFVLPCTVQTAPYIQITPPITRPAVDVLHVQSPPVLKTTTPLKQASPWLQEGGDRFSVVNIYTRRQEQLKKLLEECPVVTSLGTSPLIVTSVGVSPVLSTGECPLIGMSTVTESDDSSMETDSIIMENSIEQGQDEVDQEHVTIPSAHEDVTNVQQDVTNVQQDVTSVQQDVTSTQQDVTSTQQDVTNDQQDDPSSPSAITPPGSSSFNESFTTPPLYNPMTHPVTQPTSDIITSPRRFSPHSLEVKLRAELNVLEAVGEGVRQLEGVESTRVVSLAQQETVALATVLKSQRQADIITNQTESEQTMREFQKLSEEANKMSEKLKEFEYRSKQEAEMHSQQMRKIQEVSCQKVNDITEQLLTNQSAVTTTIIDITEKQLQSAHDMAVGVAKTAAQEAVISALKQSQPAASTTISYKSDFEESIHYEHSSAATLTPTSLAPPINIKLSPQLSGGGSTRSQSLTPVPSERSNHGDEEDHTITEGTISEEQDDTILTGEEEGFSTTGEISEEISHIVEDDDNDDMISETSFRELLPSESHRRKHKRNKSSQHTNDTNDSIEQHQHQLLSGNTSPISGGGGGDESFLDFMSRMLHQYTKEEEMRAKHQAALLELREKAIKEKTDAQLKWLKIKKGQVQKRGDDLAMPSLLKRERGILKQLQHEQAEIQRLKEVHRAASNERRLFLLQQQDISRINRSAHYYKDKIRKYGSHNSREQSPYMDISPSPSPSIYMSHEDIHYSLSSMNTSPNKSLSQSTTSIPDMISQSPETTPISLPNQTIPVLKSSTIDHDTIKLRQKTAQDAERLLNKRTEQLIMKRKKAEDLLRTEQEILQRKMELDKEEERIALIIEQANECHQQIEIKSTNLSPDQTTPLSAVTTPTAVPITSIHERLTSTMNISSINYGTSSFDTDNNSSSLTKDIITTPTINDIITTPTTNNIITTPITNDVITTPTTNEIIDNESCQIDQLKTQLRTKEQKIKQGNINKENQQQQTFNHSSSVASLPKTELTTPIKDSSSNDTDQTTPTDFNIDLLSPISSGGVSSSSSASTVISTAINSSKDNSNNDNKELPVLINNMGVVSSSEDEISEDLEQESGQSGVLSPILVEEQESGQSGVLSPIPVEQESGQSGVLSPILVEEQESGQSGVLSPIPVEEQESTSAQPSVLSPIPVEQESGQSSVEAQKRISLSKELPIPTGQHVGGVSSDLTIGTRVLVGNKIQGTIQYIGETEFNKGIWIGVELDYERGKNDGSVNGKRYFTCSPKYGLFAPPSKVVPLESEMSSDSEDSNHGNHSDHSEDINHGNHSEDINHGNHSEDSDHGNHSKASEENDNEIVNELLSNSNNDIVSESNGVIEDIVSHSEEERPAKNILAIKRNINIPVDNVTEELLRQLTSEAFGTVHSIWKTKDMSMKSLEKIDEVATEATTEGIDQRQQLVDNITDDLLNALVATEVNVMCNIQSVKSSEHDVKCDNTVNRERVSFSSEPLSLVPCTRETINDITLVAWNAVINNTVVPGSPPSDMIRNHCTMSPGPMLDCQVSFVKFVYQLAMEVINDSKSNCKHASTTKSLASFFHKKPFTLQLVQSEVYALVQQSKQPTKLLPPRYLAGNCRPAGGKIVDGVDLLLIKELRDEEPTWVNYDKDEEEVKMRTADEILDLLLNETVEVLNNIYRKKTLT